MLGSIFLYVKSDESAKLFSATLFVREKYWKQPKCIANVFLFQQILAQGTMEYYAAINRMGMLSFFVFVSVSLRYAKERQERYRTVLSLFYPLCKRME